MTMPSLPAQGSTSWYSWSSAVHDRASSLPVNVKTYGAVGNGTTDDTAAIQAAINSLPEGGGTIWFPRGTYKVTTSLTYARGTTFRGAGMLATTVDYSGGSAGTYAFQHNMGIGDQWPGRVTFEDLTIQGNATGTQGAGATVSGIACFDTTSTLINTPFYSLHRVRLLNLATGIRLEGYGHHFQESVAYQCATGFDLTHPEQAMLLNCWADYCATGVAVNIHDLQYGHSFHILGGSYQRCSIGIQLWNLYEPKIETYFELNTTADVMCGDPADETNYTKGVKGLKLDASHASAPSNANVALYATVGAQITFRSRYGSGFAAPHVNANGYSKWIDVQYDSEAVESTSPWNFAGDSALRSIAHAIGGFEKPITPTGLGTSFTLPGTSLALRYFKTSMNSLKLVGELDVGTSPAGAIFTLPYGYRPATSQIFRVAAYAGGWTNGHTIEVKADGTVNFSDVAASRALYFDNEIHLGIQV